jgi:hypothetical protein
MSAVSTASRSESSSACEPHLIRAVAERTRRHCAVLEKLVRELAREELEEDDRLVGRSLTQFFDVFFEQWQPAEERLLLRPLAQSSTVSDPHLREIAARLADEHRRLHQRWGLVRLALLDLDSPARLLAKEVDVPSFVGLLHGHLLRKEVELHPLVSRLFGKEQWRSLERQLLAHCG